MDISIYGGSIVAKDGFGSYSKVNGICSNRNKRNEMDLENQRNYSLKVELVTSAEAAVIAGISKRSWSRLVQQSRAPQPIHLGGCIRWRLSDIEQWINDGCEPSGDSKEELS